MANPARNIQEAITELRLGKNQAVRAQVGDMILELRRVGDAPKESAKDAFEAIGPWAGDDVDDVFASLAKAKIKDNSRRISDL